VKIICQIAEVPLYYYIIPLQKGYPSYKTTFFIAEVPLYYYISPLQKGYPSYKATFFIAEWVAL
jgi:hypothetical protein